MRRLFGLIFLCTSLALLGAAKTPIPTPTPLASATPPTPSGPVVLIYPFDVQGGVNAKIGIAIAQILAQEMVAAGGLTVLAVPNGIKRADFLKEARRQHADFYISGFVTPVGESAAVVEQLVTVDSGIIVFSQTAQVSSVADVASQSLFARSVILARSGLQAPDITTTTSNTPAPTSTNGAQMKIKGIAGISGIVDSVFHHGKAAPSPSPTPLVKPARGVIVARVSSSGTLAARDLTNATNGLYFSLNHHFVASMTGVTTANVQKSANSICGEHRDNTIATGTLAETPQKRGIHATFTLFVYTCFGAQLDREIGVSGSMQKAIDAAVQAYAKAHPDNS